MSDTTRKTIDTATAPFLLPADAVALARSHDQLAQAQQIHRSVVSDLFDRYAIPQDGQIAADFYIDRPVPAPNEAEATDTSLPGTDSSP